MEGLASRSSKAAIRGLRMFDERCGIERLELWQDFVEILNEILVIANRVPKAKRVDAPTTRAWLADYWLWLAFCLPHDPSPRTIGCDNERIAPSSWGIAFRLGDDAE